MKKYKVIYTDCPWPYRDKRKRSKKSNRACGGASVYYDSMIFEQLCGMHKFIHNISDEDCILFMWATFPNIELALKLMKVWGFKYKTQAFTWIKINKNKGTPFYGIGAYSRSNTEVCLLGIKGKPKVINKNLSSVVLAPREAHSKKPDIVRDNIVTMMGDVPRIELFARQWPKGWSIWGRGVGNESYTGDILYVD